MVKNSARLAVSDVLKIELNEKQSQELYYDICSYLINKNELCYTNILKFKSSLLFDNFDQELIDYFVMEYMLQKIKKKYPLILDSLTYIIVYQS